MFPKIRGRILFNEPLFKHTTFRIGGPCRIWVEPRGEEDLREILKFADSKKKKIVIIGKGSNILFRDRGYNGIAVHLGDRYFKKVSVSGARVIVGAGTALGCLVDQACKKGLSGIEGLVGIPGTVGGAIFMNSGYRKQISDCLEAVRIMDSKNGKIRIIKRKNITFGYRHSNLCGYIILEAHFRLKKDNRRRLLRRKEELLEIKKIEQPIGRKSAGCIFKNPRGTLSAAQYIEMLRLKGKRIGGAGVSTIHANFIVNLKKAKARDVLRIISFIKRRVKSRFDIDLVPEIVII